MDIRPLVDTDVDACIIMSASQWFDYDTCVSDAERQLMYNLASVDFFHLLRFATAAYVAYENEKIYGCVMSTIHKVDENAYIWKKQAEGELLRLEKKFTAPLCADKQLQQAYRQCCISIEENVSFSSDARSATQGEILLFLVDKQVRGKGVGGALWEKNHEYFSSHDMENYFLYTDTTCDFSFYDAKGLTRAKEEKNVRDSYGKVCDKYIYIGTVV
ncbi:MAG: hypothetical protein J6M18_05895 [Actinomycetaceae bacterium]|nr:hypothetical protein [Actinomycetaceae bacterium]